MFITCPIIRPFTQLAPPGSIGECRPSRSDGLAGTSRGWPGTATPGLARRRLRLARSVVCGTRNPEDRDRSEQAVFAEEHPRKNKIKRLGNSRPGRGGSFSVESAKFG
jgi:hypothetical protein